MWIRLSQFACFFLRNFSENRTLPICIFFFETFQIRTSIRKCTASYSVIFLDALLPASRELHLACFLPKTLWFALSKFWLKNSYILSRTTCIVASAHSSWLSVQCELFAGEFIAWDFKTLVTFAWLLLTSCFTQKKNIHTHSLFGEVADKHLCKSKKKMVSACVTQASTLS